MVTRPIPTITNHPCFTVSHNAPMRVGTFGIKLVPGYREYQSHMRNDQLTLTDKVFLVKQFQEDAPTKSLLENMRFRCLGMESGQQRRLMASTLQHLTLSSGRLSI